MAKGEITHIEFPADDPERAKRFYSAITGWKFEAMEGFPNYWLFQSGERAGGGLGKRGESVGDVVRVYLSVDSIEEGVAAAEANGGTLREGPAEVPGQGRYAVLTDPEGNEVALWESTPHT